MTWSVACRKGDTRWLSAGPDRNARPVWKCACCSRGNVLWIECGAIRMVPECRVCHAKVELTIYSDYPRPSLSRDYW